MGRMCSYECTKCDYAYHGTAGLDFGFVEVLDTFVCMKCNELSDLSVGEYGLVDTALINPVTSEEKKYSRNKLRCKKCRSKVIRLWNSKKKPCPREGCGGKLKIAREGLHFLWD